MRQLMLSLDKRILDPESAVAKRMIEYGKTDQLYIIIPTSEKKEVKLSEKVIVVGTGGGSKLKQWGRIYAEGEAYLNHNKVDVISSQDPFGLGLNGVWLSRQFKVPFEVQLHGDFFSSTYYRFKSGLLNHARWHIAKYVVRRADRVRVVGERVLQSVVKLGVNEEKITMRPILVDYSPLDGGVVAEDLRLKYPEYEKIFVFLGRFDPVKNISWLIDAFVEAVKKNPNLFLLIVGDGPLRLDLEKKVDGLMLPNKNIRLEPWATVPRIYYQTADCILFPSLSEGYGLVAMEAAGVGTKVIMTDVGVANYELKPSDKVKIVPIGDKEVFIKEILTI